MLPDGTHSCLSPSSCCDALPGTQVYKLEVLDAAACAAMGMGCYLGVADASLEPARYIHLNYKPKGEVKKKVRAPWLHISNRFSSL